MKNTLPTLIAIGAVVSHPVSGTELSQEQIHYFETHIRPALVRYCYDCHSEETGKTRGGLLLDTREGMLRGGDNGNVLAGSTYKESLFWDAINWLDLEMPPKEKLPAVVIDRFETWLKMGAPDPRNRERVLVESKVDLNEGRRHWAYQPPTITPDATIDSLVQQRLDEAGLQAVSPADARTLLRRIHFDLVGLPPTPEEIQGFLRPWRLDAATALAERVDELLARPQFGERWGRHWLDVARYAESSGKDVNQTYPHIWRYRDYVFDSFNADKPYDEFIREQVAGDLLKVRSEAEWQENLIATGFLAMGTKSLNQSNPRQHRMDIADEQIDILGQAVLGLTISCARCHDHKYDPIPTTDYYALAGIFLSTETFYGTTGSAQNKRSTALIELPIADPMDAKKRLSPEEIAQMNRRLQQLRTTRRNNRGRDDLDAISGAALRRQISDLQTRLSQIGTDGIPATMALGVQDARSVASAPVLLRGDVEKPAQTVARGFLQVLPGGGPAAIRAGESGRRELADWLTRKDNPLTARVMVNRIWLQLFGEGLVASPNNWGTTGQPPSHPRLLDLLAVKFMEDNWSIKRTIRRIVLSETYRRGSKMDPTNHEMDPESRFLWRVNPRPVDAEALRDSILTLGGGLDLARPYGSQISAAGDQRVGRGFNQGQLSTTVRHRSVYLPILRDDLPDILGLFDFADPNSSQPKRAPTNVPAQSLYLMNNPLVLAEAAAMARNLARSQPDTESRVRQAFLLAFARLPDEADLEAARQFFERYRPTTQGRIRTSPGRGTGPFRRGPMAGGRPPRGARPFGGPGNMMGGPGGRPPGSIGERPDIPTMTPEEQTLALFCQGLMASAEFRVLN